jgi:flagellar biosynthesis GTPase FlhF
MSPKSGAATSAPTNLVEITTPMPDSSVKSKAEAALARVKALVITSPESYAAAAADLAAIKGEFKVVDKQREDLKAPSLEGCRRVDAFFKPPLDFLRSAEQIVKGKLTDYDRQQEQLRIAEQRRLDEEARKERERKEAEAREVERKAREKAESERKAADEARKAEERARREADEAKARGDREAAEAAEKQARAAAKEAAKLDTRAERTEAAGEEKAATLQAAAHSVVAPVIQREPPKIAGLTRREDWKFEVTDPSKVPREYLMVDEQKIGKVVKALKKETVIAGVRVYPVPILGSASA